MPDRSHQMVEQLRKCNPPDLYGYVELQNRILLAGPGSPCSLTLQPQYTADDLRKAVAAGLLEKRRFTGSVEFEFYGLPCIPD
jgi:hypothetical protein